MTTSGRRVKRCTTAVREGRRSKADQFWTAASLIDDVVADGEDDLVDAYITLCIHAGIAAADVICCARTGTHAQGENHHEAVQLLGTVDEAAAKNLRTLLDMKTRSGYSARRSGPGDRKRAQRAAGALLDAARRV